MTNRLYFYTLRFTEWHIIILQAFSKATSKLYIVICGFLADVLQFATARVVVPLFSVDWKRCTILLGTNLGLSFVPVSINGFCSTWWINILILIHYISEAYPKSFITCKNMIWFFEIFKILMTMRYASVSLLLKKKKKNQKKYLTAYPTLKKHPLFFCCIFYFNQIWPLFGTNILNINQKFLTVCF